MKSSLRAVLRSSGMATVCCALLVACGTEESGQFAVGEVEFATPGGSGEPNLFATEDGRVLLNWFEPVGEGHALKAAVRSSEGWTEPVTIAAEREFFVNWADFPSLVELADGTWVAHWLEKIAEGTYAYHAMLSRSDDQGLTWSDPEPVHEDRSPTEHGFVSMIPLPDGRAAAVWLDGRNTMVTDGKRGAMQLRSNLFDSRGEMGSEFQVDDRICDCCQTAMVRTTSGLVAAYRDRSMEEIRDIAVVRYADGTWSEPVHVGDDNWKIPGCPVNGPALAASVEHVAIAWFTGADDHPRVFVAFSDDGGRSFGPAIQADDGAPLGRTDITMLEDGSALVVWLERADDEAEVRARRIDSYGNSDDSWLVAPTTQDRRSGFPRMVRTGSEIVFAWTLVGSDGGVRVAVAGRGEREAEQGS